MAVDIIDINQIAIILSQLIQNYNELAQNWFDVFYNPEQMDVTLKFFDPDGNLQTYTLPNRAKDFGYVMNGIGDPEGQINAKVGTMFLDTQGGDIYLKRTGESNTGWQRVMSMTEVYSNGKGSPEGVVTGKKGDMYVDLDSGMLYTKTTATGATGWSLAGAGGKADQTYVDRRFDEVADNLDILNAEINEGVVHKKGAPEIITSDKTFNSNITITGNTNISGPTTIDNTTNIKGVTIIDNATNINGATNIKGTATISDTTTIGGATTINNTANIKGVTTIDNTTNINGATNIKGTATISDIVTIGGATTINNTASIKGATTIGGVATINNTANLNGATNIKGDTTIKGVTTIDNITNLNNDTNIKGATTIKGVTTIGGVTTINNTTNLNGATNIKGVTTIDSATTIKGATSISGTLNVTNQATFTKVINGTAYRALSADIAEYYSADERLLPGTLVQFGGKNEITKAVTEVNAVVSSEPAYVLNAEGQMEHPTLIALEGRIPVRVIGAVRKFDKITLSSTDGVATVDNTNELCYNIIGRALEDNPDEGEKLVECVVKLSL